jgi:hypothetical protein
MLWQLAMKCRVPAIVLFAIVRVVGGIGTPGYSTPRPSALSCMRHPLGGRHEPECTPATLLAPKWRPGGDQGPHAHPSLPRNRAVTELGAGGSAIIKRVSQDLAVVERAEETFPNRIP